MWKRFYHFKLMVSRNWLYWFLDVIYLKPSTAACLPFLHTPPQEKAAFEESAMAEFGYVKQTPWSN